MIKHLFGLMMAIALLVAPAFQTQAHGNHKTINAAEAIDAAKRMTVKLTREDLGLAFGKLPASWADLDSNAMEIHQTLKQFFIVSVDNPTEKKKLYLLIAKNGDVYDANFTGVFEGLTDK